MPDPFSIQDGLAKWPSVDYRNTEKFLCQINKSSDLPLYLELDYKAQHTNIINVNLLKKSFTNMCLLNQNTASQRMPISKDIKHYITTIIEKDGERSGEKIYFAYCACTARLLGCCNHVTAMLCRLEAAVHSGATKASSTSVLACWNVSTGCKTTFEHKSLADLTFHEYHYKKKKN